MPGNDVNENIKQHVDQGNENHIRLEGGAREERNSCSIKTMKIKTKSMYSYIFMDSTKTIFIFFIENQRNSPKSIIKKKLFYKSNQQII